MAIPARWALAGTAACVALLAATWVAAFHIGIVREADQWTYAGFGNLSHHGVVRRVANLFVGLCDPPRYVIWAPVAVVIALLRGRPRVAVGAGAILLGANVTTEVLKRVLAEPRPDAVLGGWTPLPAASWPSGHSTAAMAAMLCLMLASPARLRPLVAAFGAAFAIAVGYSLLAVGTHYPSDIFGGFLVATTWTLVIVAALSVAEGRAPIAATADRISMRAALVPQGAVLVAAALLVGVLALGRPHDVVSYALAHKQLVVVAAAIATLSVTVSTGVMLSLRR